MDSLIATWLKRVAASPDADRLILRGSLVTRRFFPSRVCEDVDHLVLGPCDVEAARALAISVAGPLRVVSQETIWAETPFPGVRTVIAHDGETLQIDLGWGDPLTSPPERVAIDGASVLAVAAESMVAWKLHGLVELGPRGRWRPKDLLDLGLYAGLPLDPAKIERAIAKAFESRGNPIALLDSFLGDPAWGASSGSRKKWRRYIGTSPDLAETIKRVRSAFGPRIEALR
jgi:hypothetical protein